MHLLGNTFSDERWARIRADYAAWWAHDLDRPLIAVTVGGYDTPIPEPSTPCHSFTSFYDDSVTAETIVDVWDYNLSTQRYFGDAYPLTIPNFGPGVIAAFMGCALRNSNHTVWFEPEPLREIADISLGFDPNAPWFARIADVYRAAIAKWQGRVMLGMTDLGGNLDILASFRTTQNLLMDLYDSPDEVKRLTWEAHESWWRYFEAFNNVLQPVNPGYTAWVPIFSEVPYYILQCDFAYMLSPGMFDEFVKPELAASCARLGHAFYHLDGVGQLPHLDSLLAIPDLKGVQWVMGDGQPDAANWIHIYRKILDAGKLMQISTGHSDVGFRVIDMLARELGTTRGIVVTGRAKQTEADELVELLRRHGAGA